MVLTILIILLIVALLGGGFGYTRYGYAGLSPAGLILIVLVVMYFTGHLRFG